MKSVLKILVFEVVFSMIFIPIWVPPATPKIMIFKVPSVLGVKRLADMLQDGFQAGFGLHFSRFLGPCGVDLSTIFDHRNKQTNEETKTRIKNE